MSEVEPRTVYVVGTIVQSHPVSTPYGDQKLPLTWADGMVGVLAVFEDKEKAESYAEGTMVLEFSAEYKPKENTPEEQTLRGAITSLRRS